MCIITWNFFYFFCREFHCANCGKQFKRKDKLKEHMTKLHNSQTATEEQMSQVTQTKKFVPKVFFTYSKNYLIRTIFTSIIYILLLGKS